MPRIVVFGNSGSGKTTYARARAAEFGCPHMDLDSVAWMPAAEPTRRPIAESKAKILKFTQSNDCWVVEGCYADLLEFALQHATEVVFLNPGVDVCVANAKARPWEPHKYESPAAQDANLEMLIDWIKQYDQREDEFSYAAHRRLFDSFQGSKREFRSNERPS